MNNNIMMPMSRYIKKFCATFSVGLAVAQLLLVLGSWLVTAMMPELRLRSLLGGEGVRWFFESLSSNIADNGLVWLLLSGMAWGSLRHSRLLFVFTKRMRLDFREKFALWLICIEAVLFVAVMLLLTAMPHAPLLGVTGNLFPGSFSRGVIPVVCIGICLLSVTYGLASGKFDTAEGILDNLSIGIVHILPVLVLYMFLIEFYCSLKFVLLP